MESRRAYIGVDVGTTSARAALFDNQGFLLSKKEAENQKMLELIKIKNHLVFVYI
jgi:ribulose kinase